MNTYAINLVKKWNQLASKHVNFASYLKDVKEHFLNIHADKDKLKNYFSPFNIFSQMFIIAFQGFLTVLIATVIYIHIKEVTPTSSQLIAFFMGFTTSKFVFSFLFNDFRILKKRIAKNEAFVEPFLKEVSNPLDDTEQLKKILPILEEKMHQKEFKALLLNATKGSLQFPDALNIFTALNEYFEENINSKNFVTIHTLLDKEDESFTKKTPDDNNENIKFFTN